jgi:hypothetical protein
MRRRRFIRGLAWAAVAVVGSAAGVVLLVLWYHWSEARPHQAVLRQALSAASTAAELDRTFGPPLPIQAGHGTCPAAGGWGELPEVQSKCRQWPSTRTYLVQGNSYIYVVYFDTAGRMRDFTLFEN